MASMAQHAFTETLGRDGEIKLIVCSFCNRPASKLSTDECAMRELNEGGAVMIRFYNPKGITRFMGRQCVTCHREILDHYMKPGKPDYFCTRDGNEISEGITV